jgi:transglutaminase-like putative cysteine protease
VKGDTVIIDRSAHTLDQTPAAGAYLETTRLAAYTTALGQAMARTGSAQDSLRALVGWVRQSIKLGGEEAPGHAAGAVRSRTASAEGKVQLLVQLARLAGMPARPVVGVDVSQPELPAHVWAEVWQHDRWVAVDPVFGHAPAAASLLRVVEGFNARPLALVPLVASLRTTILTTSR